ncbi:MAG: APC family permease [Anaerolineaceae bacterium]
MIKNQAQQINIFEDTSDHKPKRSIQTWLIGHPLTTADAPNQTIGKLIGLAVFSSDAMSSVAYGPQETMVVLAAAGIASLKIAFPIIIGITLLLLILTFSYRQTIHAYPGGGGAYIVARDNLGELPAQTAGAALLTDYILTVAVSISSGVAQIISAYPLLYPYRVIIAVGLILVIMVINLRGVKESGFTFAIPTYFFLILIFSTVIFGFIRFFTGSLGTVVDAPVMVTTVLQPISLFLILRAFANGTSSLTGVEAISNGITAFRKPRSSNAAKTLVIMALILGTLLLGITFLSTKIGAVPSDNETVISQLIRTIYNGRGFIYILNITATTIILVMAANTAFADFPRLGALHAGDGFLPRQLTFRGSRLVFSRGIIALALIASLLVIVFQASVTKLIPLYAIGVFLSFTLSQSGMARRWWKSGHLKPGEEIVEPGSTVQFDSGWFHKMIINGFGALCTAVVTVVFAVTKFKDGAWVVIILTPIMVATFFSIHHHYKHLAKQLSLDNYKSRGRVSHNRVIMPISGVHSGTLEALNYAQRLSDDVTAVHISTDPAETAKLTAKWQIWGDGVRLVVLNSPYRLFLEPLLLYINKISENQSSHDLITIVVPQFIPKHWWTGFLHTRTAESLRKALIHRENLVITEVPYQVK